LLTLFSVISQKLVAYEEPKSYRAINFTSFIFFEWMGNMPKSRVLTAELRDVDVLLDVQLGDILSSRFWILVANSLLKLLT
jgi:hypothetical protein